MQSSVSSAVSGKSGILSGVSHAGPVSGFRESMEVDCPHPDGGKSLSKVYARENIHSPKDVTCLRCKKCRFQGRAPIIS
jgi:hypothetical protein